MSPSDGMKVRDEIVVQMVDCTPQPEVELSLCDCDQPNPDPGYHAQDCAYRKEYDRVRKNPEGT